MEMIKKSEEENKLLNYQFSNEINEKENKIIPKEKKK